MIEIGVCSVQVISRRCIWYIYHRTSTQQNIESFLMFIKRCKYVCVFVCDPFEISAMYHSQFIIRILCENLPHSALMCCCCRWSMFKCSELKFHLKNSNKCSLIHIGEYFTFCHCYIICLALIVSALRKMALKHI